MTCGGCHDVRRMSMASGQVESYSHRDGFAHRLRQLLPPLRQRPQVPDDAGDLRVQLRVRARPRTGP